ncbi:hypothetical protein K443DRAFT_11572 [Laccaria amethystina LaAM-08-1]|uniref:Major facilitator superfamily (MFS) profile domain-containing protein n=1 Tax=Laccaria amethystina LaAM-08-1 TaxID=1095629 RepID=A0A0C9X1K8_9AGAR|nr:hypothetical protein K443DRAFT_11572 [Laccaria amethystina LaAM-08-1]
MVTGFVLGFKLGLWLWSHLPCQHLPLLHLHATKCLAKIAATLVARMISGLCISAPICNVWAVENRGSPVALFSGTLFMGPCIGPMIGGWIGMRAGWRWIYCVLFIFVEACFIFMLFIPETLAPVFLRKKAKRLIKLL